MTDTDARPSESKSRKAPQMWLGTSILALFLLLPGGIVAIFFSLRARSQWAAGEVEASWASSVRARTWALSSVALGVGLLFLLLIVGLVYGSNDLNTYP